MQQSYPHRYPAPACNGDMQAGSPPQQQVQQYGTSPAAVCQIPALEFRAGASPSQPPYCNSNEQAPVNWYQQPPSQSLVSVPQQYFPSASYSGAAPALSASLFPGNPVSAFATETTPVVAYSQPDPIQGSSDRGHFPHPTTSQFPNPTAPNYPSDPYKDAANPPLLPAESVSTPGQPVHEQQSLSDAAHRAPGPVFEGHQRVRKGEQSVGDTGVGRETKAAAFVAPPLEFRGHSEQPAYGGVQAQSFASTGRSVSNPVENDRYTRPPSEGAVPASGGEPSVRSSSMMQDAFVPPQPGVHAVPPQQGVHTSHHPGRGGEAARVSQEQPSGSVGSERPERQAPPLEGMAIQQSSGSTDDLSGQRWSPDASLLAAQGQSQTGAARGQSVGGEAVPNEYRTATVAPNYAQAEGNYGYQRNDGGYVGVAGGSCVSSQSGQNSIGEVGQGYPSGPSQERQQLQKAAPIQPVSASISTSSRRRPSPEPSASSPSPSTFELASRGGSQQSASSPASSAGPGSAQPGGTENAASGDASSPPPPRMSTLTRPVNSRIDPCQVPRPEGRSETVTQEGGRVFESDKYNLPPNPCSVYTVLDRGSCSCRYVRCTLNHVPAFSHTLSLSSLFFGILVQPFAQKGPCEEPIPVVDLTETSPLFTHHLSAKNRSGGAVDGGGSEGRKAAKAGKNTSEGPVRCPRCRAYINPFMAWAAGGNECVCNLCDHHFLLPEYYMEALHLYRSQMHGDGRPGYEDRNGDTRRKARPQGIERNELWKGSVDFVAPPGFEAKFEARRKAGNTVAADPHSSTRSQTPAASAETPEPADSQAAPGAGLYGSQEVPLAFSPSQRRAREEEAETKLLQRFPCVVFVVDVSMAAVRSNLANSCLHAIAELLRTTQGTLRTQIALVLYSDRLIFFPRKRPLRRRGVGGAGGADGGDLGPGHGGTAKRHSEGDAQTQGGHAGSWSEAHETDAQTEVTPEKIQAVFVSDVDDPFMPAPIDLLFFTPHQYPELLALLQELPKFLGELNSEAGERSVGNAALRAAVDLVCDRGAGGMVEIFYASPPNHGVGSLKSDPMGKVTTGVGGASFEVQQREFYEGLLMDCSGGGVCVDVHAYPSTRNAKMLLQTLGSIATHTGGKVFYQHDFIWNRDYMRIYEDLHRLLTSPLAFMCEAKLRTSTGVAVDKILAPFGGPRVLYDQTAFRIPRMDADMTIAFLCKHVQQLDSVKQVYVQFVCAYTPLQPMESGRSPDGSHESSPPRRYLRVHTLSMPVTFSLSSLFRFAEVESTVAVMTRLAAKMVLHSEKDWREKTMEPLVSILHAYRANCASTSSAGQLILPDSLKLLPVYIMSLFKHAAFRSSEVREDERIWHLIRFMGLPVHAYPGLLYPRVFPIHRSYLEKAREKKMLQRAGLPTGVADNVYLPDSLAATGVKISSDGVFLCDVGTALFLYVGQHVKPEYLAALFGEGAVVNEENAPFLQLRTDDDSAGSIVSRIVGQIRKDKATLPYLPLRVVNANSLDETRLLTHLVEDAIAGEGCYVDFLCGLHKMVHSKLDES
ncbi:Sec23/Sec24 trunk domain-containing protein [Toxoplasma gondii RUB]|uniref:Sec23/Sec24 trunk domain-containing protein n=1 Tax=Toxoplasma gondii RUB TaxID=935652 RepID=A0A086LW92_TOXGO|nr:Sec23/Sec24 trunk domain-containing protein [Toxoplasma gondii RUB]